MTESAIAPGAPVYPPPVGYPVPGPAGPPGPPGLTECFDVVMYGASPSASATTNSAAFAAALQAAQHTGGVVCVGPGTYNLASPLVINNPATGQGVPGTGITLRGAGRLDTILAAPNTSTDILSCGQTGALGAWNLVVEDVGFSGGRYQLRLNNCIQGTFRRLWFSGGTTAVYCEGQNEQHVFDKLFCFLQTGIAINVGQSNGASSAVTADWPEMQKCLFKDVNISGCQGTYAVNFTAGTIGGQQQQSGWTRFEGVRLDSFYQHGIRLSATNNVVFDQVATEGIAKTAANTYTDFWLDGAVGGNTNINVSNSTFAVNAGNPTSKYYIAVDSGSLTLTNCNMAGGLAAGTADVYSANTLTMIGCVIHSAAALVLATVGQRQFTGINVYDVSGYPVLGTGVNQHPLAQQTLITGGTVDNSQAIARVYHSGAITGVVLPAGRFTGQEITIINEAGATITMSGYGTVIPSYSSRRFVWDMFAPEGAAWFG